MVIVLGPAFSQKLLVVISVYNLTFCSSFHGRSHTEFLLPLHNRLHILIRDRLDDIPIFIEHLNIAAVAKNTVVKLLCDLGRACSDFYVLQPLPDSPDLACHASNGSRD
jgi:hypothetical protein